jgi:hypothetical protein
LTAQARLCERNPVSSEETGFLRESIGWLLHRFFTGISLEAVLRFA